MITGRDVSVIIPTHGRHEEVLRAVTSVLKQSETPREVIVVNDGPDPEKRKRVRELNEPTVEYYEAKKSGMPGAVRNFGCQMADGQWIALLDDDDVWLPQKLELQLLRANASKRERLIIAGRERVIPESGRRERIRPGKGWVGSAVDMNELLFGKEGGVHISTVVAPRQWFLTCPFDETRPRHEDAGWLLRAAAAHRASCWIVDSVVTERAIGDGLSQNGQGGFWESWGWYEEQKALLGVNGRCDFVAGGLAVRAGWDLDWAAAVRLGRELWRMGPARPSLWRRLVKGLLRGGGKRLILGTGLNRLGLS